MNKGVLSLGIIVLLAVATEACDRNVRDFGAVGDGVAKDTVAIQAAIDDCAKNGGGRVVLAEGRYLTGTLTLKTGVDLHVDASATLDPNRWCSSR